MIVVADMGSTKTDWSFVDETKKVFTVNTKGFNPYFYTTEEIVELLKPVFSQESFDWNAITNVYFYGAGCSSKDKQHIVREALQPFFPKADLFLMIYWLRLVPFAAKTKVLLVSWEQVPTLVCTMVKMWWPTIRA